MKHETQSIKHETLNMLAPRIPTKSGEVGKHKIQIKIYISVFLLVFLGVFLLLEIFASQIISPLYVQVVNEDKSGVVNYLKKIVSLAIYKEELSMYKITYGEGLGNAVLSEKLARDNKIQKLEQLLVNSPKSRDVLYSLFLLHQEDGNKIKAEKYLQTAREVDPELK